MAARDLTFGETGLSGHWLNDGSTLQLLHGNESCLAKVDCLCLVFRAKQWVRFLGKLHTFTSPLILLNYVESSCWPFWT